MARPHLPDPYHFNADHTW
ncbi:hypothetical protein U0070_024372 [Myodes glareolus]|uniref:Uncharacterized protein n=1 Tax=Myodes glareolus TaxID=447135 RepID=A0AAW0IKH9_MYOGA